jgi:hypothetical protein
MIALFYGYQFLSSRSAPSSQNATELASEVVNSFNFRGIEKAGYVDPNAVFNGAESDGGGRRMPHPPQRLSCRPMQNQNQRFRLRAPASGREAIAEVEDADRVYVDRESGEEMRVVSRTLPLAPSDSALLRTPGNLRACRRCDQLIGLDVSDCPYCGLRQPALDGS